MKQAYPAADVRVAVRVHVQAGVQRVIVGSEEDRERGKGRPSGRLLVFSAETMGRRTGRLGRRWKLVNHGTCLSLRVEGER